MSSPPPLLAPTSCAYNGPDRRGALRRACEISTEYYALGETPSEPRLGWVVNVSTTGLALVVGHTLSPDTMLGLELRSPDVTSSFLLMARVVLCLPYLDGWLLGCAFERPLPPDELANLL
jgi:hypothetical protein